ncbi:MAG: ATP-binding cassette domain-containing protein [Candidatus Micrarchaeales archaeon]|nr:ATP-binding cassette domain-containing protein [Candidatus Micrarchaeales archaeon]
MSDIIKLENLTKKFGDLVAVNNVSLNIKEGEIFGLLGPNGAGKTTIINMVLSLLHPTSGRILVNGLDVVKNKEKVKQLIGMMTQETVVEPDLTGAQNLELFCQLYHIAEEKIPAAVRFGLEEADLMKFADVKAGTYSGGMQRRLGLVRAMLQEPKLLLLDEPTTGLDVQNRVSMWQRIKDLNKKGTTLLLTTQYLEEADELCDRLAIIDHGRVIAQGTPSELKRMASEGEILEIITSPEMAQKAANFLRTKFRISPEVKGDRIKAIVQKTEAEKLTKITKGLEQEKIPIFSISIHLPTLDDVFIKLTGATIRDTTQETESAMTRTFMGRHR